MLMGEATRVPILPVPSVGAADFSQRTTLCGGRRMLGVISNLNDDWRWPEDLTRGRGAPHGGLQFT
jgi:hypothetical protein